MRNTLFYFNILLGLLWLPVVAQSRTFHQVQQGLTLEGPDGQIYLRSHSFLRQVNAKDNLTNSRAEVFLVNDYDQRISDRAYSIPAHELNHAIAHNIKAPIQVTNESGESFEFPSGVRLVRVNKVEEDGRDYYEVIRVDDIGNPLDDNDQVVSSPNTPPLYQVSQEDLEDHMLKNEIEQFFFMTQLDEELIGPLQPCPDDVAFAEFQPIRPRARPDNLVVFKNAAEMDYTFAGAPPYQQLMNQRSSLRGRNNCESRRRAIEAEMMQQTPWADMSIYDRANKVHELAKFASAQVKAASDETGRNSSSNSRFRDSVNPHYTVSQITPNLMSCIVFQETRGQLNYIAHNYTYCQNTTNPASTAHGLGQLTRRTFRLMKNLPDGDQFPYVTDAAQRYSGLSTRQAHEAMSGDPIMQMELVFRLLNYEYKFARWQNPNMNQTRLLREAVARYDRDHQSAYLRNVMDRCLPCMDSGKSASECYREVFE